jgi:hypothetical protein
VRSLKFKRKLAELAFVARLRGAERGESFRILIKHSDHFAMVVRAAAASKRSEEVSSSAIGIQRNVGQLGSKGLFD